MSLFCLNCLRSVVKCLGDKLWGSTAVAANPSSAPPCHTLKPQSLCSDHSGFPTFSSQIQWALNQVNISSLLPEPLPHLGVTLSLMCRQKAKHPTESPWIHCECGKGKGLHRTMWACKKLVTTDWQPWWMQEQWVIQWYIFWRTVFRSVAPPRKPPGKHQCCLGWKESGNWRTQRDLGTQVSNLVERDPQATFDFLFQNLWKDGSPKLQLHRMKWKTPKFVYGTGQDFRKKGKGCGTCCLYCNMHPTTTVQMGVNLEENMYPNGCY